MHTVKCPICGKTFETDKPNAKYCGLDCQLQAATRRRNAQHERYLQYQHHYYRIHKAANDAETVENGNSESYPDKYPPAG